MLPQSVKLHTLKYKILEFKDLEQHFDTFMHILYNPIFSYINSVIQPQIIYFYPEGMVKKLLSIPKINVHWEKNMTQ